MIGFAVFWGFVALMVITFADLFAYMTSEIYPEIDANILIPGAYAVSLVKFLLKKEGANED